MEITVMTYAHPLWEKTIAFAEKCSWRAGAFLAGMMRENKFSDIERAIRSYGSENMILRYNEKVIRGALELVWLGDL